MHEMPEETAFQGFLFVHWLHFIYRVNYSSRISFIFSAISNAFSKIIYINSDEILEKYT